MSARLYLDDCAYSKQLLRLFAEAGYDVQVPADAGLTGAADAEHFLHARQEQRALVTKNPADFLALHRSDPNHSGILAIYQDNSPHDMSDADVVRALGNVLRDSGIPLAGQFVNLNQWQY